MSTTHVTQDCVVQRVRQSFVVNTNPQLITISWETPFPDDNYTVFLVAEVASGGHFGTLYGGYIINDFQKLADHSGIQVVVQTAYNGDTIIVHAVAIRDKD